MKQFEDLTIKELRKFTEQYKKLEKENKLLKIKYPLKKVKSKDEYGTEGAQEIIDELPK